MNVIKSFFFNFYIAFYGLDKLNLIKLANYGKVLGSSQFTTSSAACKNYTCLKSDLRQITQKPFSYFVCPNL